MVLEKLTNIIADAMGARLKIEASDINENTGFISDLHWLRWLYHNPFHSRKQIILPPAPY